MRQDISLARMAPKVSHKTALTIKEYKVKCRTGYALTIPVGSRVSNMTACGNDDQSRFLGQAACYKIALEMTGHIGSILYHDLIHSGINIPADHCAPY